MAARGSPESTKGADITEGSHVAVLPGRHFPTFSAGDEGVVVSVSRESQNCQVLFRGRGAPVPVALRHLKVTSSTTRLLESPITNESELDDGGRGYAEATSGWRDQSLDFSLLQEPSQAPPPPLPRTGQERSWPGLGQRESRPERPEFPFREPVVEPVSGNLTELQKRDLRIQSLEAQLTEMERAHAAEVRSLRSALEECVRAIENCAQTIDSACAGGLMGPMPNQWANGGLMPCGQASGWQSAAKALHDAAQLGLNALGLEQVSAPRTPAAAPGPPQYMMVYEPFPPAQSVVTTPSVSRRPSVTISRQPSLPLGSAPVGLSRSVQALPVMPQVLVQTARAGSQALFMQPLGGMQPAPAAGQQPMPSQPMQPPPMFGPPAAALGQGQPPSGASPFLQLPPQPLPSPPSASLSAGPGPPAGPGAFSFGAALQGGLPAFQPGAQTPGLPGLPPFRLSLRPPGNILAGLSGVAPPFGMAGFTASQAQPPSPFAAAPGAGPWSPTPSLDPGSSSKAPPGAGLWSPTPPMDPGSGAKPPPGVVQDGKLDWSRAH